MKRLTKVAAVLCSALLIASLLVPCAFAASTKIANNRFAMTVKKQLTADGDINYYFDDDNEVYYEFYVYKNTDLLNVAQMTDEDVDSYFNEDFIAEYYEYDELITKKGIANGCNYMSCLAVDDEYDGKDFYVVFTTKNYIYEINLLAYENSQKEIKILENSLDSFSMNDKHFAEDVEKTPFDFTVAGLEEFKVSENYLDYYSDLDDFFPEISEILKIFLIVTMVISLGFFVLFLVLMISFIKKYRKNKKELDEYKRRYPPVNGYQNYAPRNNAAQAPPMYYPPQSGTYYNTPQNAPQGFNQQSGYQGDTGASPAAPNASQSPTQPENTNEQPTDKNE